MANKANTDRGIPRYLTSEVLRRSDVRYCAKRVYQLVDQGVVTPHRSATGQYLWSDDDIAKLIAHRRANLTKRLARLEANDD